MKKIICSSLALVLCFLCFGNIQSQDLILIKAEAAAKAETPVKTEAPSTTELPVKADPPKSTAKSIVKYGIASYYAKKFNGRQTSTGAIYNSTRLTAACNVLPLGTWVKVTNLKNKKSVIVEINDHMHHKNKRLIDLSKSAAQKLGFISKGITRVKVEVLSDPPLN